MLTVDVVSEPDIAGPRGKWMLENVSRRTAAAAAAGRAAAARTSETRGKVLPMRERLPRTAPTPPARGATRRWIRSASRSRTSTPSASGGLATGDQAIDASGALPDGSQVRRPGGAARSLLQPLGAVRDDHDRKAADVRARTAGWRRTMRRRCARSCGDASTAIIGSSALILGS